VNRAWGIVAVAFVANFVSMGTVMQPVPVFLVAFAEEFVIGRGEASLISVVMLAAGAVIMPLVGRAIARFPIRNLMVAGALVLAGAFYAMSLATEFWQVLVLFSLPCGFGAGALGVISTNTLMVNWFEGNRGLVLGVAMMGMSLAGVAMVPLSTWAFEEWGWRGLCRMLAAFNLAVVPLVGLTVVTRPSDVGLRPQGADVSPESELLAGEPAASTREILTNPSLWMIAAASGLVFFGSMGIMNHGLAFAQDRGIDPLLASGVLSAIALGAGAGKLVFGWLAGRIGEHGAFATALVMQIVTLAAYLMPSSYAVLITVSLVYGLGLGGISPLQAALLARGVGVRNFGPAQGLMGPVQIPFQITGPPLAGFIFDARGSYDLAIMIFIGALVVSGIVLAALYSRDVRGAVSDPAPA